MEIQNTELHEIMYDLKGQHDADACSTYPSLHENVSITDKPSMHSLFLIFKCLRCSIGHIQWFNYV